MGRDARPAGADTSGSQPTPQSEKLECDVVMRGGITSGIVYPLAIAKLAETYRFRSIGGTSAGAIAAAVTAAAAYGARAGKDHFQSRIKGLPVELGGVRQGRTVLERLFQPAPGMRRLFRLLMGSLRWKTMLGTVTGIVSALWWQYRFVSLPVTLATLAVFAGIAWLGGLGAWALIFQLLLGLLFGLLLGVGAAVLWATRIDVGKRLPNHGYGMCPGHGPVEKDEAGVAPLTDWLHELIQSVADRSVAGPPLTFGDLWGNGGDEKAERDIELVLMTTNATRGLSHRFPFVEGNWGPLFFRKDELDTLFPAPVVDWLVKKSRQPGTSIDVKEGYYRLPKPAKLPILLAARMSLSFPFLLSAVPLHAPDFSRRENGKAPLRRCWFSDGGLTSNFPIHFFDAPLPSRPTFGINLMPATTRVAERPETAGQTVLPANQDQQAVAKDPWRSVWMPTTNSTGIQDVALFNEFDHNGGSALGFFMLLFDTARNWADTELMAMPGYRDRIVHVQLAKDEGGLNLNMPQALIEAIGERGTCAGELLAARFAPTPPPDPKTNDTIKLTWDNHRWVRYRTMMAALEHLARRFRARWEASKTDPTWRSYEALLQRPAGEEPTSYVLDDDQRVFAEEATAQFVRDLGAWGQDKETFDLGDSAREGRSPRPKPGLRMMPPGDNDPRAERLR